MTAISKFQPHASSACFAASAFAPVAQRSTMTHGHGCDPVQLTSEGAELTDSQTLLSGQSSDHVDLTVSVGHGVSRSGSGPVKRWSAGRLLQEWKQTIVRAVTARGPFLHFDPLIPLFADPSIRFPIISFSAILTTDPSLSHTIACAFDLLFMPLSSG